MVGRDAEAKMILDEYEKVTKGGVPLALHLRAIGHRQDPPDTGVAEADRQAPGVLHVGQVRRVPEEQPLQLAHPGAQRPAAAFLTESDERVALWRSRMQEAVGQNGKSSRT
jgi:hypothetical protein